jgi:hypothetical protein
VEAGFAEGYDLGVGCGVVVAEDSVLASADDLVVVDNDCAYGNFPARFGGLGFGDGGSEVGEVVIHLCAWHLGDRSCEERSIKS